MAPPHRHRWRIPTASGGAYPPPLPRAKRHSGPDSRPFQPGFGGSAVRSPLLAVFRWGVDRHLPYRGREAEEGRSSKHLRRGWRSQGLEKRLEEGGGVTLGSPVQRNSARFSPASGVCRGVLGRLGQMMKITELGESRGQLDGIGQLTPFAGRKQSLEGEGEGAFGALRAAPEGTVRR